MGMLHQIHFNMASKQYMYRDASDVPKQDKDKLESGNQELSE